MKYIDYVDLNYKPSKNDLVCEFFIEPKGIDIKIAAGAVAAESSIGTWTEILTTKPYVEKMHATVFDIRGNNVRIAYPIELFEMRNMPNILSSVAGNVFGLKEVNNLRLNDISLPLKLVKSFRGPKYGIEGIRNSLKIRKRCLAGTIIKPKLGLETKDHAKVAYDAWIGGCDIVKDDENLSSQKFNKFENRIVETLKMRNKAEKETGERKAYLPNITAETNEMIRRAKFVEKHGGEFVMVDVLTVGFSALQTLRNENLNLIIHAHRAMHGAITKNPKHGISMKVLAKLLRIAGVDLLHVGTAIGKMFEAEKEVLENIDAIKDEMFGIKKVMPVASGGLWAGSVPGIMEIFGSDVVIQSGGGVHGLGTKIGSKSMRQAIDATMQKVDLEEYAKSHRELRLALEKWKGKKWT